MSKKIFISTSSFGEVSEYPIEKLRSEGYEVEFNPHGRKLTADEINELAIDCDALIAGTEDLSILIKNTRKIRIISRVGVGTDSVPLKQCKDKGIKVTNTPDAVTSAVAELTISLILCLYRDIHNTNHNVKSLNWKKSLGSSIEGSVIGIAGFGKIGQYVANILIGFNPKEIIIVDPDDKEKELSKYNKNSNVIRQASKEVMLENSDVISLHLPYTDTTVGYISKDELSKMKKSSILINTSRGNIIDEKDLFNALKNNEIKSVALDVYSEEPYTGPLIELENILLTSHIGSYTSSCRLKMESQAVDEVIRFFNKQELHCQVI